MMHTITARDLMVSNLVTLSPDMEVIDALNVLLKRRISGAPVVDEDRQFLGIFSEKSCMRFVVDATYDGLPSSNLMSFVDASPPVISAETDLLTIAQTFLDAACRRLPVLDDYGRLLGQISRRDIMGAFYEHMKQVQREPAVTGLYLSALMESTERPV
ncbi:CBS domain-containing protein [Crateriforma conspicua]|uniref:Inosine-5'-monophosphate dehydrogenase n=1 Tax=Crateriforma conspicua TaxID=2527996 RepID=A0A5C5Y468_9PLAN|nr:CBS domain-containing protein [Crateriforma conspicua]QDV64356.1 Inosine-5'-monophosphate dehydrogenase [Crateriforma conspicua]TWT69758.1 Inosine-5'-monophosphate dehydrogenase [Crateriforma conspicua]